MASPKFSEDVRPLTDLKTRAGIIVERLQRSRRPVLLTRRGRGVAVLMDLGEYERLVERAAFIDAVDAGAAAVAAGELHEHAEARAILDAFGETDG